MGQKEIWKDVVGYRGIYQVSDRGWVMRVGHACGATPGRILKPAKNGRGYLKLVLCRGGKPKTMYVHRLVAEAFLGPAPSPKHEVNHRNGDKADNRVENLEWATCSENHQHAYRVLGRQAPCTKGEAHGNAKLTARRVKRIRKLGATGKYSQREIGKMFGVSQKTVSLIIRRETWKHVP